MRKRHNLEGSKNNGFLSARLGLCLVLLSITVYAQHPFTDGINLHKSQFIKADSSGYQTFFDITGTENTSCTFSLYYTEEFIADIHPAYTAHTIQWDWKDIKKIILEKNTVVLETKEPRILHISTPKDSIASRSFYESSVTLYFNLEGESSYYSPDAHHASNAAFKQVKACKGKAKLQKAAIYRK